jgi:hypothetical protein
MSKLVHISAGSVVGPFNGAMGCDRTLSCILYQRDKLIGQIYLSAELLDLLQFYRGQTRSYYPEPLPLRIFPCQQHTNDIELSSNLKIDFLLIWLRNLVLTVEHCFFHETFAGNLLKAR